MVGGEAKGSIERLWTAIEKEFHQIISYSRKLWNNRVKFDIYRELDDGVSAEPQVGFYPRLQYFRGILESLLCTHKLTGFLCRLVYPGHCRRCRMARRRHADIACAGGKYLDPEPRMLANHLSGRRHHTSPP